VIKPARLQLSRRKGFDLQAVSRAMNGLPAVSVARPSLWGNPFIIGKPSGHLFQDGGDPTPMIVSLTREQSVELYGDMIDGFLGPKMHPAGHDFVKSFRARTGASQSEWARTLCGFNLACFCRPGVSCHADQLLERVNRLICEEVR
jgi:hypothetical protein